MEETANCQELQKPDGFPHTTRLDQTSLLTSVATGYYFTELTNFRWGAVIKWSGKETCSCLLMPQVFTAHPPPPKKNKNIATARGKYLQVWLLNSSGGAHLWSIFNCSWLLMRPWARNPTSSTDAVQKLILTPAVPAVIQTRKNVYCLFFEYVPGLSELSVCSYFFNASWKYPRFKALNQWFLWLKHICVVCRNISCLHRGTVFYGKCGRGVKFSGNYRLLSTNKPIPSAFWTPDAENSVNSPLNSEEKKP